MKPFGAFGLFAKYRFAGGVGGGSTPLVKMPTPPAARAKMAWGVDYNPLANPSPFTMYHFAYGDDPT